MKRRSLRGVTPYIDWPPSRTTHERTTCPHCEREFVLEPYQPGVRHSLDACGEVRKMTRGKLQESFWMLALNARNKVVGKKEVCRGTANECAVHPRDIFREAMRKNAVAVILAHNHPTGNVMPSPEDERLTERLIEAGKVVAIPVLDHIVVSESDCYSFRDHGKGKF